MPVPLLYVAAGVGIGVLILGIFIYYRFIPEGPHGSSSQNNQSTRLATYDDLDPNPPKNVVKTRSLKDTVQSKVDDVRVPVTTVQGWTVEKDSQTTEMMSDRKMSKKSEESCQECGPPDPSFHDFGSKKEMKDASTQWYPSTQVSVDAEVSMVPRAGETLTRVRRKTKLKKSKVNRLHGSRPVHQDALSEFLRVRQEYNLRRRNTTCNKGGAQVEADFTRFLSQSVPNGGSYNSFNIGTEHEDSFSVSLNDLDQEDNWDNDSFVTVGSDTNYPSWNELTPEEKESLKCRICGSKVKTITFPCKHPYTCQECAPFFFKEYRCRCLVCRHMIKGYDFV